MEPLTAAANCLAPTRHQPDSLLYSHVRTANYCLGIVETCFATKALDRLSRLHHVVGNVDDRRAMIQLLRAMCSMSSGRRDRVLTLASPGPAGGGSDRE